MPVDALGNPTYYRAAEESDETRGPVSSGMYIVPSPSPENSAVLLLRSTSISTRNYPVTPRRRSRAS